MRWTNLKKGMKVRLNTGGRYQWYGGATVAVVVEPRAHASVCTLEDGFLTSLPRYHIYNRDMVEAIPAACIMRGV